MINLTRLTLKEFCQDIIKNPYLCYTEHGIHAYFFVKLYNALPADRRYADFQAGKVCVIQKEYPTASDLGRSRRQSWDIAVLKTPLRPATGHRELSYDFLQLDSAIEFGLNEGEAHLIDDIERLSHDKCGVDNAFIVHLYRLSKSGALISSRDWPAESKRIVKKEDFDALLPDPKKRLIEVFYGVHGSKKPEENGLWKITKGSIVPLAID